MKRAQPVVSILLLTIAIGVLANASHAQEPGPLADPKSEKQAGFPTDLYSWVIPPDNPQTPAKAAVGKGWFCDGRLSADGKISCDHCHGPAKGFTDQLPTSMGINNQFGQRNAPTVLNALFNVTQFWDGRSPSLEAQIEGPVTNPVELGQKSTDAAVAKIKEVPQYQKEFQEVFGRDVNFADMERAIAAYERPQFSFDSPFDKFINGDQHAISDSARRGWSIFNGKGRCMSCHVWNPTQPLYSDMKFHNIGVSAHQSDFVAPASQALDTLSRGGSSEQIDRLPNGPHITGPGRFLVTKHPHDIGPLRTMGLRNLLVTQLCFPA